MFIRKSEIRSNESQYFFIFTNIDEIWKRKKTKALIERNGVKVLPPNVVNALNLPMDHDWRVLSSSFMCRRFVYRPVMNVSVSRHRKLGFLCILLLH